MVNNLSAVQDTRVWSLDQENALKKGIATHSSILVWGILWREEPDELYSLGLQITGHNRVTLSLTHTHTHTHTQGAQASLVAQIVNNLPAMQKTQFNPWIRKFPGRRTQQPTPVFLSGEFHGQRSLAGYSLWGRKKSDTNEWLTFSLFIRCLQAIALKYATL